MGRISRSKGQDKTLENRHIMAMLRHIEEYELYQISQIIGHIIDIAY